MCVCVLQERQDRVCVCECVCGSYQLCGRRRGSPLPRRLLRARGGAALSRDGWRRGSPPTYAALVRPPAAWRARRCAPLCERFCAAVTLHCLSLVLLVVVMVMLLVQICCLQSHSTKHRRDCASLALAILRKYASIAYISASVKTMNLPRVRKFLNFSVDF